MNNQIEVKLVDKEMAHRSDESISNPYIKWYRADDEKDVTIFTDRCYFQHDTISSGIKMVWFLESPQVNRRKKRKIHRYKKYFQKIFTFNKNLLEQGAPFSFCPLGTCWIDDVDRLIYPKNRNLSIILSDLKDLEGHKLRHQILESYRNYFDGIFGRKINYIEKKLFGLRDFRYSVVCENCREDYYFSEKLIDCFMTGTIPIYWGCPSIGKFFDSRGIIQFSKLKDLKQIVELLSEEDYNLRLDAIQNNFRLAQDYFYPEKTISSEIKTIC